MAELSLSQKKMIPPEAAKRLLDEAEWGQGRSAGDVSKQIHSSDLVFSVWEGTEMVAFCRVLTDYSYVVSIWDFVVSKNHMGQGVGNRLLKAIMGHPDLLGIKRWTLYTPIKRDFFEQHGFLLSEETLVRYG